MKYFLKARLIDATPEMTKKGNSGLKSLPNFNKSKKVPVVGLNFTPNKKVRDVVTTCIIIHEP